MENIGYRELVYGFFKPEFQTKSQWLLLVILNFKHAEGDIHRYKKIKLHQFCLS
jgi:hypothetical protein